MRENNEEILKHTYAAVERAAHIDFKDYPIDMSFSDGVLTLDGEVPDIVCKKLALNGIAAVPGVENVVDRLRVKPGERAGDGAIRNAICDNLLRDVDFQNCELRALAKRNEVQLLRQPQDGESSGSIVITVEEGVVTLWGHVISLSHKRLAGVLAWWTTGCRDVVNSLEISPPEEDNDDEIADALRLVLETDPVVPAEQIGISARDHVVTLEGIVATEQQRRHVELDAWYIFGVSDVVNRIQVHP